MYPTLPPALTICIKSGSFIIDVVHVPCLIHLSTAMGWPENPSSTIALVGSFVVLSACAGAILGLNASLSETLERLSDKVAEGRGKDEQIVQEERKIAELQKTLTDKSAITTQQEEHIEALRGSLAGWDAKVLQRDRKITELRGYLYEKEVKILEQEKEIKQLRVRSTNLDAIVSPLNRGFNDVRARDDDIRRLGQANEELEEWNTGLQERIVELEDKLAEYHRRLKECNSALSRNPHALNSTEDGSPGWSAAAYHSSSPRVDSDHFRDHRERALDVVRPHSHVQNAPPVYTPRTMF